MACMFWTNAGMDGWTDAQPETNMPRHLLRSWGHNYAPINVFTQKVCVGGGGGGQDYPRELDNFEQVAQRATIAHLSPMCQGQISFQKIQTHPSFNACSCYMKVSKGSNQKQQRKRSIGVFLRRSRAANSVVGSPIWPKFELIHNIMHVLVTSKFDKDRININRDYVMTSIF